MSKLSQALEAGRFPVVAELTPPKGVRTANLLAPVTALRDQIQAFGLPDNAHARLRLAALAAARLVLEAGGEPLLHMTCRDRNRLALESDLLGAAALGLENLLIVSGDYITLGDHPDAKPVYDADSVQLLQVARLMMAGQDSAGGLLEDAPHFFLGAVVIPEADPLGPQLLKFRKKVAAGAQFVVTAPIFDLEKFKTFQQYRQAAPVKLLATVKVLSPEDVAQASKGEWRKVYSLTPEVLETLTNKDGEEFYQAAAAIAGRLAQKIKKDQLADGLYLKAQGRPELMKQILDLAGL